MKNRVHFSFYCIAITVIMVCLLLAGIVSKRNDAEQCLVGLAVSLIIVLVGLFYCPTHVSADGCAVAVHRALSGRKVFRYDDIKSVDTIYPSAGGIRLCGSGGFFGYWGYFSDILIGQYFGYYADRSQCFVIKLKNDRQYVVSCENHVEMVTYIRNCLDNR